MEITKRSKVRRAKLYYLRTAKGKKAKLKRKDFVATTAQKAEKPKIVAEKPTDVSASKEPKTKKKPQQKTRGHLMRNRVDKSK